MLRPSKCISECIRQKDWLGLFVIGCGAVIACWVVSTVFSLTTRELALRRFQLASPSFAAWAVLAPVPSMYNFENKIQFTNELDIVGPPTAEHELWFSRPVNHFPARCVTFGEFAPLWFSVQKQGTFEMSSRFRETELVSRWEVTSQEDGIMIVRRVVEDWKQHDAGE